MERLTKRENGHVHYPRCFEEPCGGMGCRTEDCEVKVEIRERLAAYEDTGLEPEEVSALVKDWSDLCTTIGECGGIDRLRELAEADKDGRLLVLPSNKALTNADRMRASTNQQLAKQIYDTQKELCRMLYKKLGFEDELNFSEDYSDILAWLNAPSKEAEKALEAMTDG
jgi:hypothetical protein